MNDDHLINYATNQTSNSIVGVLPGHEGDSLDLLNNYQENDWLEYARDLVRLARKMGKKVIVVGHSTGGLIGTILAQENRIDGLIAVSPALALTTTTLFGTAYGSILKLFSDRSRNLNPYGGTLVSHLIQNHISAEKFKNYKTPSLFIFSDADSTIHVEKAMELIREIELKNGVKSIQVRVGARSHMDITSLYYMPQLMDNLGF